MFFFYLFSYRTNFTKSLAFTRTASRHDRDRIHSEKISLIIFLDLSRKFMPRANWNYELIVIILIVEIYVVVDDERWTLAGCWSYWFIMIALTIVMFWAQLGLLIVGLIRTFDCKKEEKIYQIKC